MKSHKFFSALFGLLGIIAAAAGIFLSLTFKDASPVLLKQSPAAEKQVLALLDAVQENDFAAAGSVLYGNPSIGADRAPADAVGGLLWDAFVDSFTYELEGDFYATDSGVARDVTITALDIDSVTAVLRERSQTLLQQRVEQTVDADDVYDENNDYREDFVMQVLYDAAAQALQTDAKTVTYQVTMNLIYENGQWWIMPEDALIEAITGGII